MNRSTIGERAGEGYRTAPGVLALLLCLATSQGPGMAGAQTTSILPGSSPKRDLPPGASRRIELAQYPATELPPLPSRRSNGEAGSIAPPALLAPLNEVQAQPTPTIRLDLRPDTTGFLPTRPPGPPPSRSNALVASEVDGLIDRIVDPEAELGVVVGRSKLIRTRQPVSRIAIANPAIADLQLLADQPEPRALMLYGLSFGTTNLTIWNDKDEPISFLVRVSIDTQDLEERIKAIFPGADVRVKQIGSQVLLEGQVTDAKMMAEVLQVVSAELRLTQIGGAGTGTAPALSTGPAGETSPATSGAVGGGGGGFGTTGPAPAGGGLVSGQIINRVKVPGPKQVLLKVKIAELDRSAIRQIGVNWLDARNKQFIGSTIGQVGAITGTAGPLSQTASVIQGALVTGQSLAPTVIQPIASNFNSVASASPSLNSQLFGIFNAGEFSVFLNALRQNDLAKILAEPNLVAIDGQPARFIAGGQFPYPVPQTTSGGGTAITIQFAQFGAILEFLPTIMPNGVIRLDVQPNFSRLNPATGVSVLGTSVPGIDERSARTVVELREGQTLALAGLLQTTTTASTARVPGLGDLPLVGSLFSRSTINTIETELVVLVTPELVAPVEAKEMPPSPGDLVMEPNDLEFYFLGRIEGKTGHPFRATTRHHDPFDVMKHARSEDHWVVGPHGHSD